MMMLVMLLAISVTVYGQEKSNKTLLKTEVMAEKLGLDKKQKAALDKQLKEAQAERKAQIEKLKALREEMKRDAFVARQEREAELKEILTAEQWATYQKMKEEGKKRAIMGKRMKRGNQQGPDRAAFRKKPRKRMLKEKNGGDDENPL